VRRLLGQVACFVAAAALVAVASAYVTVYALGLHDPKWDPGTQFALQGWVGAGTAALGGLLFAMALTGRGRRAARPGSRPPRRAAAAGALYAAGPLALGAMPLSSSDAWGPGLWLLWTVGAPLTAGYALARAQANEALQPTGRGEHPG
jgi:hypothetical protein